MDRWYVLYTAPHKETLVASRLRAKNLAVYLPLVRDNAANQRAARPRPYFPSYLFVHADPKAVDLGAIRWTPGLRHIVHIGGEPAVVPEHMMHELQRRVRRINETGGLERESLQAGETVRVVNGPFSGYEAVFDARLRDGERVHVFLELLKLNRRDPARSVRVELNVGDIARTSRRRRRRNRRR